MYLSMDTVFLRNVHCILCANLVKFNKDESVLYCYLALRLSIIHLQLRKFRLNFYVDFRFGLLHKFNNLKRQGI